MGRRRKKRSKKKTLAIGLVSTAITAYPVLVADRNHGVLKAITPGGDQFQPSTLPERVGNAMMDRDVQSAVVTAIIGGIAVGVAKKMVGRAAPRISIPGVASLRLL